MTDQPKPKILIVDDEESIRDISSCFLGKAGFEAMTAQDGAEALSIYDANKDITAVLTDVEMPNMNGIELTGKLKQINPALLVIMHSSDAQRYLEQAREAGTDYLIQKSYRLSEVSEIVANTIERKPLDLDILKKY
jgi:two-component system cell cycle sensor histidine kinase/response regulator CckA